MPLKLWPMGFSGWSPEAVEFFQDLEADNTKAFWSAHKDLYEASVREPMAELLDELSAEPAGQVTLDGGSDTIADQPDRRWVDDWLHRSYLNFWNRAC